MTCYPKDCPPVDAEPYKGKIFRFIKSNPPSADDCKTAYDLGNFINEDLCKRHALSCGVSEEYLNKMKKLVPRLKKMKKAFVEIDVTDGVIKQTGDNLLHYSFWVKCDLKSIFHKEFKVIES